MATSKGAGQPVDGVPQAIPCGTDTPDSEVGENVAASRSAYVMNRLSR